jgi:DNA-binding transcriptional MerR regulator
MSTPDEVVLGIRSRAVCELLSIPASTLNYWVQIGIARPSIRAPEGRRVEQVWSVEDVVIVRAVRVLRSRGASLQQVRKAQREMRKHGVSLASARLVWDGDDVLVRANDGELVSMLRQPGQGVLSVLELPLDEWHRSVSPIAKPVDLSRFREQKRRRDRRRRLARETSSSVVELS